MNNIEKEVNYSLSFVHLADIKNAVLKFDKKYDISFYKTPEMWKEEKGEIITFFKGFKDFTLQEIIGAWLHEISFFGDPDQRNKKEKEVFQKTKNIEKAKTIPHEKLLLKWKKSRLKDLKKKKATALNTKKIEKTEKEIAYLKKKLASKKN